MELEVGLPRGADAT